ncbi:MAG: hypothetical protein K1Y02_19055 [Candidatus Hydrogenedentes bacterium]|nr:hypothetical protein [Candidatus Hydrogenedentota bacterium]
MFKQMYRLAKMLRAIGTLALVGVMVSSCSDSGSTQDITESRTVAPPSASGMPSGQPAGMPAGMQAGLGAPEGAATAYTWDVPEGWEKIPPTSTRIANFKIGADTECYLTVLPGMGGGPEANVNRWRKQMSQADYTAEEFAALEKKTILEKEAIIASFDGTYVGMGGSENKSDYALLGAIFDDGGNAVFIKMVGPKATVDAEREHFNAFCQSLKRSESAAAGSALPEGHPSLGMFTVDENSTMPAGHPDVSAEVPAGDSQLPAGHPEVGAMPTPGDSQLPTGHPPIDASSPSGAMPAPAVLTWTAPDTWKPAPEKAMRVVTFTIGESGQTECYITSVSKAAGGAEENINLLRRQMGQEPLDAAGVEALPKVTVLGQPSPFLEVQGAYTGMDGSKRENYLMYAVVSPADERTVFVKLTGPEAEVKAERDRFVAFCESLKIP